MNLKPSEKEIQNQILEYFRLYRKDIFVFQHNNGCIWDPSKKIMRRPGRFFVPGVADIIGIKKEASGLGRFLAIEIKRSAKEIPSPAQKAFLEQIRLLGGISFVAHNVESVIAGLASA